MTHDTATTSKPFEVGTTGWTASDLEDFETEGKWFEGRYEIVEGVLTQMAAAYYIGGKFLVRLFMEVQARQKERSVRGDFSTEVDIIIDDARVARSDAVWMTPQEQQLQARVAKDLGRLDPDRTRILIPPSLVIEVISPGHEAHDRRTKRKWYAEFGVPRYWIMDPFERSLECLLLDGAIYKVETAGRGSETIRPVLFDGLQIDLANVWAD